jgi:predicted transcriptional regulator
MLRTLQSPASPEKLAQDLNRPVYIVRSSLREMERAGLLSRRGEDYVTTEAGKAKL